MYDFEEMTHPLADYCQHAGVGKACRACRRLASASAVKALADLADWHREEERDHPHTDAWYEHMRAAKDAENFSDANFEQGRDRNG